MRGPTIGSSPALRRSSGFPLNSFSRRLWFSHVTTPQVFSTFDAELPQLAIGDRPRLAAGDAHVARLRRIEQRQQRKKRGQTGDAREEWGKPFHRTLDMIAGRFASPFTDVWRLRFT